jgi:polyhydroxyalkanoate synthesis regulator phasin
LSADGKTEAGFFAHRSLLFVAIIITKLKEEVSMAVMEIIRNALLAGFGVQEKVKEFIDDLVKRGELSESEGAKLVKEWSEKVEKNTADIGKSLNEVVTKALERMKLPSKDDITKLNEKVDALSGRVSMLEGEKG